MTELKDSWLWYLDSGAYEQDCFYDLTWGSEEFVDVFDATKPPAAVSFDFKPSSPSLQAFEQSLEKGIALARERLSGCELTLLLRFHDECGLWEMKPDPSEVQRISSLLSIVASTLLDSGIQIHVLGVAENELGPGIRARLRSLAKLRLLMEVAGLEIPIHVFGASDPQALALYALAGGDIFDGVSWSRYYLDTDACCLRDKGLFSWRQPHIGESESVSHQSQILGVSNVLRMQEFLSRVGDLIETGRPQSSEQEMWTHFVEHCCGDILPER
jgi:hypothetical protein